jgi:hypothetical protein
MAKTQKTIEVTIKKDGTSKVEAFGFTGGACMKETEGLEEALGQVTGRSMKSDASKPITIADQTKIGSG